MTRSAQQPPASPRARAESGPESEETAAAVLAESTPQARPAASEPEPEATSAPARTGADPEAEATTAEEEPEPGTPAGEAGKKAGAGGTATAESGSGSGSEPVSNSEPEPDSRSGADPDSGATAAAESRLPALVRTMTATAIGRPQQTGPVGRPGKAVLAGAAIAGALLVSVPFLVLATDDGKDPDQPKTAAGTVLTGSGQETPGEFAVTPTEPGDPGDGAKGPGTDEKPVREAAGSAPAPDMDKDKAEETQKKGDAEKPAAPKKQSAEQKSGSTKSKPAPARPAVTLSAPVSFHSQLSGRCIDVPGHDFSDGKALHMWDCNNAAAQKWQFASDGTIRIQGLCLDVANANFSDGAVIQIARCSDNPAQKFALNGSHDLVNTVVGMCVDIAGANRDNRAALQLLKCSGNPAQKWNT